MSINRHLANFITLTILYGSGIILLWWSTSWKAALAVFILLWASNVDQRYRHEERILSLRENHKMPISGSFR